MHHRVCGAITRRGGRCARQPAAGRRRCKRHGGASSGPRTPAGKAAAIAAATAGRRRWLQRMRAAKARGEIARFPNGRLRGVPNGARAPDKYIRRAQRQLELMIMERTNAARLSELVDRALEQNRRILSSEFDPNDLDPANLKRMSLVLTAAQMVFSLQFKVDEARLRDRDLAIDDYETMFEQIEGAKK